MPESVREQLMQLNRSYKEGNERYYEPAIEVRQHLYRTITQKQSAKITCADRKGAGTIAIYRRK